ncbi:hypothetical protein B0J11DRAFT_193890 [Dendryphion nanum]|uniref:Zn(2)-C6 fungal-type domain-containing protein n=1 Tax=Dendryphion nanum TaxID=256645 RepID=A0A9P9D2M2_9PLEO|nr:hypothetical protein B0J11DRAFT_193890 [Dendryphion nanum]
MNGQAPRLKVAIPRLGKRNNRNERSLHNLHGRPRVGKACNNCHNHKVKCTGEQPCCQKCVQQNLPCLYSRSRKDRLSMVTKQNSRLITFLIDLKDRVHDREKQHINAFLDSLRDECSSPTPRITSKPPGTELQPNEDDLYESNFQHSPLFAFTNFDDNVASLYEDASSGRTSGQLVPFIHIDKTVRTQAIGGSSSGLVYENYPE